MAIISIDLGGTKLSGAIIGQDGSVSEYTSEPLNKRTGDQAGRLVAGLVNRLLRKAKSKNSIVSGIGCCIPGIVYRDTGTVWAPNIPGWENYPLLETIRREIHPDPIKILIDNDRACSIMGEIWQGMARGCKDAIFIAVGTGIGAGIVSGGSIIRGRSDIAGAVGWLALDQPYRDNYIPVGCFEYHASGDGLARITREYLDNDHSYNGKLRQVKITDLSAFDVFKAFDHGDPIATRVLEEAVTYWGMAVANLVSIFNPEKIIFGGGVFGPATDFLERIEKEASKWAQPVSIKQVEICASSLGNHAGILGAAYQLIIDN